MKTKILRITDRYLGNILTNVFSIFKNRTKVKEINTILIVNLWGMGDAALTLPLIKEVKQLFPAAQLDILATKRVQGVYLDQENVDNILLLENFGTFRKLRYYDLAFDSEQYMNISALAAFFLSKKVVGYSHGQRAKLYSKRVDFNDRQHMVHTYLDLLRVISPDIKNPLELVKLSYNPGDQQYIENLFEEGKITKDDFIVGLCVNSAESAHSRKWAKEKFAQLADLLVEKYKAKIVIVGAMNDYADNETVIKLMKHSEEATNTAGKTTLKQSIALIDCCKLFISNDTGPMHLAAAQSVPTIGLFGPNLPLRYSPYGRKNIAIRKAVIEEPCINVHKGTIPDCKDHNHMSRIEVEDVMREVEKIVKN